MSIPPVIDYSEIRDTLATYRADMQAALDSIGTELTGPMSRQWNMDVECYVDGEKQDHIPIEYGYELPRHLLAERGISWAPSLGGIVPHQLAPFAGHWRVLRFHEEWYDKAKRAHDAYNAALPDLANYVADQDVDIDELIAVPDKVETFVNEWFLIAEAITDLPSQITDIGRLQGSRWTGTGADAHKNIAEDMSNAASATVTGISNAWVHASMIGTKAVEMAANLLDIAADSMDNALWAKDLIVGFSPDNWLSTVNSLINKAVELDQQHMHNAAAVIREIAADAEYNALVASHFTQLQTDLGGEIIWPRPDPNLNEAW